MLRLYALYRGLNSVPLKLQSYTIFDKETEQFVLPALKQLKGYSLILTTRYKGGRREGKVEGRGKKEEKREEGGGGRMEGRGRKGASISCCWP
jgi:hypothetical protein